MLPIHTRGILSALVSWTALGVYSFLFIHGTVKKLRAVRRERALNYLPDLTSELTAELEIVEKQSRQILTAFVIMQQRHVKLLMFHTNLLCFKTYFLRAIIVLLPNVN